MNGAGAGAQALGQFDHAEQRLVGGLTSYEGMKILHGLRGLDIIGGDVVEVSPPFDSSGITALAGAQMMFDILCLAAEAFAKRARK